MCLEGWDAPAAMREGRDQRKCVDRVTTRRVVVATRQLGQEACGGHVAFPREGTLQSPR